MDTNNLIKFFIAGEIGLVLLGVVLLIVAATVHFMPDKELGAIAKQYLPPLSILAFIFSGLCHLISMIIIVVQIVTATIGTTTSKIIWIMISVVAPFGTIIYYFFGRKSFEEKQDQL